MFPELFHRKAKCRCELVSIKCKASLEKQLAKIKNYKNYDICGKICIEIHKEYYLHFILDHMK